ncbi:hypothetical protein [Caballeronia sp. DA-9]|uniref:hypothetical protein n=1 Tax=Caballeronia sp. DA-9 TaxID=3436237 RepID=UPI003F66C44E
MPTTEAMMDEQRYKEAHKMVVESLEMTLVAMQAAWIEWRHGKGAEEAMQWIENTLSGPGLIPDEDAPYGKEPQAWFDANQPNPNPVCACGRPSNIVWMGKGFCSEAHYDVAKAEHDAQKQTNADAV